MLAESNDIDGSVASVAHYVASRLIDRERALASASRPQADDGRQDIRVMWRRHRWRLLRAFVFGLIAGCAALFAALWIVASRLPN